MRCSPMCAALLAIGTACPTVLAGTTRTIMLVGYWPPTNDMIRRFSTNPERNPDGWIGRDWEGRGYDVVSYFPEFPNWPDDRRGEGDFEVDYQDTSADFWPTVTAVRPVAIVTFSLAGRSRRWELETQQPNYAVWADDYVPPRKPDPSPPDESVPAGYIRRSTLPMEAIAQAIDAADFGVEGYIDTAGDSGDFLSGFMAYHGMWYQSLHGDPRDVDWCVAAGHIHVGVQVRLPAATTATEITLRTLIEHVDAQLAARCIPDVNRDGRLDDDDFFDFLNAFLAGDPAADFDRDGDVTVADVDAFLVAFISGC